LNKEWRDLGTAIVKFKKAVLDSMPFLPKMVGKIACLLGSHFPAPETLKLAPEDRNEIWGRQASYCRRCRKILYIGFFPPSHPNCRCTIVDPEETKKSEEEK